MLGASAVRQRWSVAPCFQEADCQLRSRTRVARSLHHRLETAVKYARYSVRLGEQRRVAERQRQAETGARQRTRQQRRLYDHHERHGVTEQHARHKYVAQLASRRHNNRRTVIADEHGYYEHYRYDTDDRDSV